MEGLDARQGLQHSLGCALLKYLCQIHMGVSKGNGHSSDVQDAMARITLDVILTTGFDLPSNAVDLEQPCPLLEDMHFLMAETFRSAAPYNL